MGTQVFSEASPVVHHAVSSGASGGAAGMVLTSPIQTPQRLDCVMVGNPEIITLTAVIALVDQTDGEYQFAVVTLGAGTVDFRGWTDIVPLLPTALATGVPLPAFHKLSVNVFSGLTDGSTLQSVSFGGSL